MRPDAMSLAPVAEDRPQIDGHDARLMCPLLREFAIFVDELLEKASVIRTQP